MLGTKTPGIAFAALQTLHICMYICMISIYINIVLKKHSPQALTNLVRGGYLLQLINIEFRGAVAQLCLCGGDRGVLLEDESVLVKGLLLHPLVSL